jgi:hypothetical protein
MTAMLAAEPRVRVTAPPRPLSRGNLRPLTGLRFIAALGVVLFLGQADLPSEQFG